MHIALHTAKIDKTLFNILTIEINIIIIHYFTTIYDINNKFIQLGAFLVRSLHSVFFY